MQQDFIVIDTEGKSELSEIAIIDSQGQLIYEAFNQSHPNNDFIKFKVKSLREIILDFFKIAQSKLVICHNAVHDIQVLKKSSAQAGVNWQNLKFRCSCELAKIYFPDLPSYSLEYLSKYLNLKVSKKYFNPNQAHTAKYDALFTHQLYLKILGQAIKTTQPNSMQNQPNPFSSSRVDTPFQDHVDLKEIYQNEFEIIKSIITDIKYDKNHQSKGAIVIGEPGTGKTHLIMRLAKELLRVNRLLFIRQPNNSDSVLYHTYSRILESFIEKVPNTNYTQLEHLLAHSFVKLISTTTVMTLHKKDQEILTATQKNHLNLYEGLGAEGTQKKREYWQHIEKRANEWWINKYGAAGYSAQIIKGIVKFCSYSDPRRQELVTRWLSANELSQDELDSIGLSNWNEEMSRESFSLEAISVFSKLSLLDEPLIMVFDQLEALGLRHNRRLLLSFGEAVKEIFTHVPNSLIILNLFPDRWEQFKEIFDGAIVDRVSQYQVRLNRPSNEKLKEILRFKAEAVGITLERLFTSDELNVILNHSSIRAVLNSAADYYRYKVNKVPLPTPANLNEPKTPELKDSIESRIERLESELMKLQQIVSQIEQAVTPSIHSSDLEISQSVNLQVLPPPIPVELDESKIVKYLRDEQNRIEQDYKKIQIISDTDDIGKLITIAEALKTIKSFEIDVLRFGRKAIPEHRVIRTHTQCLAIGFLQINGTPFTTRIRNYNELVINHRDIRFILLRDYRQPVIRGKVGKEEIEKLQNAVNGDFILINKEDRIRFELIYKLITDIQNRDFEMELERALNILMTKLSDYWLIQIFYR